MLRCVATVLTKAVATGRAQTINVIQLEIDPGSGVCCDVSIS